MTARRVACWLPRCFAGRPAVQSRCYTTGISAAHKSSLRAHPPSLPAQTDGQQPPSPASTTHFGYRTVDEDSKEQLVGNVFANVADKYDIMNDLMSAGVHRLWKRHFIHKLAPQHDTKLLDVAGGTGDIAFRFLDETRRVSSLVQGDAVPYTAHVTVLDINAEMLRVGRQRADRLGYGDPLEIDWVCGNAERLQVADASMDAYTIAFGIRNCTHIERVLAEAYRVLRPGGRFMCLEFGRVHDPMVASAYDVFSFELIPRLGELVAQDRESYAYLVESIRRFPAQPRFAEMIRAAGFHSVEWEDLTYGVAAVHSGWKP